MKAGYVGAYGPRVPSIVGPIILIGIGVVALLMLTDRIPASDFWAWYGRWWPLVLIGAGLALLGEWALDLRQKTPVRRGGSFVGIIILLGILGIAAAGWNHIGFPFHSWSENSGDFFNAFGLPERDNDQLVLNSQIPANSMVEIQNPRGDVSVSTNDGTNIEVQAHEVAYAKSDEEAARIFESEKPSVNVTGNAVLVKSNGNSNGRLNLIVTVPKNARVTVNASHGDVTAAGMGAGINVTAGHGDIHLGTLTGSVNVRFSDHKGDFSAHQVDGDVTVNGRCSDVTISEIKGRVTLSGEVFGDVHMENISGPVNVHTSVTDLQVASLPGDLTLNPDDLRVTEAKGQVRVVTHSKDVDLNQIYGDSYAENRDGRISVEPAGSYSVEAKNSKGDVEVSLPPNASGSVDARTRNGEIVSDYGLSVSGDESKKATGRIGSGGSRIVLSAENGDVHIKKGSAFPSAPTTSSAATAAPKASAQPARGARQLKSSKALPAHPQTN
jgi:DUF4097 and DUF4098 domain-containing protein YvlB